MQIPYLHQYLPGLLLELQKMSWEMQLHGKGFFLVLSEADPWKAAVTGAHFCELG